VLIINSLLLACLGLDAPSDEAKPAPIAAKPATTTVKPATTTESGDDWPLEVKVALFGIVIAVIAVSMRLSRGQKQENAQYQKHLA
jgi:hypothetical protein